MKKMSLIFVIAILIMATSCKSASEPEVITVNNATELLKALGDDRTIILNNAEGIYWLTEAIDAAIDENFFDDKWEVPEEVGYVMAQDAYDGNELNLINIKNLTIKGADEDNYTKIYVSPQYADVLAFESCTGITLENLQLGHYPEEGSCTGAVLGFNDCDGITINNCDLFGCGMTGIEAIMSRNFKITNSTIRDCSFSNIWLNECRNFHFYNCNIISENDIVCFDSREVSFEKCTVPTTFNESLYFIDCEFFEWPGLIYPDSN